MLINQNPFKEHPYFFDALPNRAESFIDWVPSGMLICTNDQISNTPVMCFHDHEKFLLSLSENDSEMPLMLLPLPFSLFDQFASLDRTALILPPGYGHDHEDEVYVLAINENGFPTGHWFEASIQCQDYYG